MAIKEMKLLITGANGFVGRSLCAELSRQGHVVLGAVRSASGGIDDFEYSISGSIDGATDWSAALCDVDIVIHLAARVHVMNDSAVDPLAEFRKVNVDGTLNLALQAAKAGIKRFVFISSIGVNGNVTVFDYPFTADDKPQPHDPYSVSKYEAEMGLRKIAEKTGLEIVIIRPPLIYGYDAPGNFKKIINALVKRLPLPLGAIHNKRSFVYVENLVSLILRCIDHPAAANQVFLVSDGHDLSTTELLQACAKALGVKAILLPVPQKLIEVGAAMLGKRDVAQRLCGSLQVDITKARTLLGWVPPISVAEGLKATALG
jgi:nucleoside-diphosphate-sugar epimerase